MLENTIANGGQNETHINTESACRCLRRIFFIVGTDKKERGIWVTFQHIKHNIENGVKDGARLKCTCAQAELVVAEHIGLVEEFYAIGVLNVPFYSHDICMMAFSRLESVLKRILQYLVSQTPIVHLKNERITI
jgi:hypothetical protein